MAEFKKPPMVHVIRNFSPVWFAVTMGTGAVSSLLHNFPYGSRPILYGFGVAVLILNMCLFGLFFVISAIRYIRYPEIFRSMFKHPVQSLFLGCFPMGFSTLINASLNACQVYGLGDRFLYALWGLWWFNSALALVVYFSVLYTMITRHDHSLKALTAVWLLPAVTPIVPATTGALLARALLPHSTSHTTITLFVSTVMLFLGLGITFAILPLYMLCLLDHVDRRGGVAFVVIGQVFAEMALQGTVPNVLLAQAQPWALVGICGGFFLWTFGIWWILLTILGIYETFKSQRPSFAVGFWGMVFPLGVYTSPTWQLSETFESLFFRVLSAILSIVVCLLWATLAVITIHQAYQNPKSLFNAPYLQAAAPPTREITPSTTCETNREVSGDQKC
ncbi:malic acid transport protein [Rhizoctonia solani]|uniref:Malic acid transport protein n=1 Tax=Rhizoctonia solani TaxID=456999 RepID=A0A8H8NWJ6_9AGAM|nr:malic acid transport protein [Rhizoctonia solani]QRW20860.1 malic acid transport protein [Rhizoctonia solani]